MAKTGRNFLGPQATNLAGNQFVTTDITASPKTSPLTVSNSVITLANPDNAIKIVLYSTANDVRISELVAGTPYFVLKASTLLTLDIARMSNLYLIRDGGSDATLQFMYITL